MKFDYEPMKIGCGTEFKNKFHLKFDCGKLYMTSTLTQIKIVSAKCSKTVT